MATHMLTQDLFPPDWRLVRLEDCMSAIIDYRGKSPDKKSWGIPLITAKIVKGGRIEKPDEFISPDSYHDWMRRGLPKVGDVLVTTEAPLGEVAQLQDSHVALAQRLIALRGKPSDLDSRYLKFCLQSQFVQDQLRSRATGTTVQGIRQSELREILLPLPPLGKQQRIGHILGTLDDKIELNRQMNETLEAMARALFQSWFIDFDLVHAKAAIRRAHPGWANAQVSRAALPSLDAATGELFPDRTDDSALGPIPSGWRCVRVPDAIDINPPRLLPKGTLAPYLEMSNMPTTSVRATTWVDREFNSGAKFMNGDTLVARITPCLENGKTAYVDFLKNGQVGGGSTEYIVLRPKPPLPPPFAYFLARNEDFRQHLITNMTGTSGRQRAPADCLNSYPIVIPTEAIGRLFGQRVDSLFTMMKSNDEKTTTLTETRDSLLPKLLSGEIPIHASIL
jgi:type I restriction enzyme S subunit